MRRTPRHFWNRNDRDLWCLRSPSRRLRKLYRLLADVNGRIRDVQRSNPCPEHAPTAYVLKRAALRVLEDERYDVLRRINALQNDD